MNTKTEDRVMTEPERREVFQEMLRKLEKHGECSERYHVLAFLLLGTTLD